MNKLENKLSSREVAPMMDIDHANLLKKIDKINEDFEKSKVTFQKYWTESTYKVEGNNKSYREFLITKRGCEFLANKTTGTKGNLFTDRYMDRFEEMKGYIEEETKKMLTPKEQLKLQLQILEEQDQKIDGVVVRVDNLENTMTIDHGQACNIQLAVGLTVKKLCCGNESASYMNKALRRKVYSFVWNSLKAYFNVTAYHNILRKDLDKAIKYVSNLSLQGSLLREVQETNNQMCFKEEV